MQHQSKSLQNKGSSLTALPSHFALYYQQQSARCDDCGISCFFFALKISLSQQCCYLLSLFSTNCWWWWWCLVCTVRCGRAYTTAHTNKANTHCYGGHSLIAAEGCRRKVCSLACSVTSEGDGNFATMGLQLTNGEWLFLCRMCFLKCAQKQLCQDMYTVTKREGLLFLLQHVPCLQLSKAAFGQNPFFAPSFSAQKLETWKLNLFYFFSGWP